MRKENSYKEVERKTDRWIETDYRIYRHIKGVDNIRNYKLEIKLERK